MDPYLSIWFWTYRFGCGCGLYPDHSTGLFINQFSSFDWDSAEGSLLFLQGGLKGTRTGRRSASRLQAMVTEQSDVTVQSLLIHWAHEDLFFQIKPKEHNQMLSSIQEVIAQGIELQ